MRPGSAIHQTDLLGPKSQLSVIGADPRVGGRLLSARIASVVGPERMFHLFRHDSGDSAWKEIKRVTRQVSSDQFLPVRPRKLQTKDERVRRLWADARLLLGAGSAELLN
jgi:hypothetical protein